MNNDGVPYWLYSKDFSKYFKVGFERKFYNWKFYFTNNRERWVRQLSGVDCDLMGLKFNSNFIQQPNKIHNPKSCYQFQNSCLIFEQPTTLHITSSNISIFLNYYDHINYPNELRLSFQQVLESLNRQKVQIKASQEWFIECQEFAHFMVHHMAEHLITHLNENTRRLNVIHFANDIMFKSMSCRAPGAEEQDLLCITFSSYIGGHAKDRTLLCG